MVRGGCSSAPVAYSYTGSHPNRPVVLNMRRGRVRSPVKSRSTNMSKGVERVIRVSTHLLTPEVGERSIILSQETEEDMNNPPPGLYCSKSPVTSGIRIEAELYSLADVCCVYCLVPVKCGHILLLSLVRETTHIKTIPEICGR